MTTYTNLGIKQIDTGDEAGAWGVSTNTNFDYFDKAIVGYSEVTLTTAGSTGAPNLLEVLDYAPSAGRSRIIEFKSAADLGGNAYVQISPNDFQGYYFVRNSLPGARSVILFQGNWDASRDFEVTAGADVIVFCTGTGGTSTVKNLLAGLQISSVISGDITGNTITALVQFVGPGTGLTGTATTLNIGGNAATSTSSTNVAVTNDISSSGVFYPSFVINTTGNQGIRTSSTKLTYQPSTGTFTATALSGTTVTGTTVTGTTVNGTTILATGSYRETRVAMASATAIDLSAGNYFQKTISGATTFTVTNVPSSGTAASIILDLTNGGSAVITWWSGVKWAGGTAPTLTSSGRDALGFYTFDGGTTWTGLLLGKNFS
jgi:hypothetical protein